MSKIHWLLLLEDIHPVPARGSEFVSSVLLGVPDLFDGLDRPQADKAGEVLKDILVQAGTGQTIPRLLCGRGKFFGHGADPFVMD